MTWRWLKAIFPWLRKSPPNQLPSGVTLVDGKRVRDDKGRPKRVRPVK